MIAADTSSLVAYLVGESGVDVEAIQASVDTNRLCLPGVVVTEILGYPKVGAAVEVLLAKVPRLEIAPGYWDRAGDARRKVLTHGFKARVADALIAQACIDHKVKLIARDRDFRHFAKHCGLVLA